VGIEVALIRQGGAMVPARQVDADAIKAFKAGDVEIFEARRMRNGSKFRRWWLLVEFAFDIWREAMPAMQHEGQDVRAELERFRKDLTVLAGYYRPVWSVEGDLTLEPESIAWASMDEARFEQLYSATIDVVLTKILAGGHWTEDQLRQHIDRLMDFDR
jgi:Protein of unknown function (DUF1367)